MIFNRSPREKKVKEKIKRKASETSCCSVFQKDSQKKSDDIPQKPLRTKVQTKVKKKSSEVSCCPIFEKDKPKKVDVFKQKPAKVKSTEMIQKKPSKTSVFSCCSFDKKSKPKTLESKTRKRAQNPFETFCAFCKTRSTKPLAPIESKSPPRQDQIKPKVSRPRTKTKSETSFQTCWDWCDGDIDDIPVREETRNAPIPSETKHIAPKSKSSGTSFWTCCSSTCVAKKAKRQRKSQRGNNMKKQKVVEEGTLKPKPENISYCNALYEEFENLVRQQKRCPILLSQTEFGKKSKGLTYCQKNRSSFAIKKNRRSLKTKPKKKQEFQKETKETEKPKAEEDKDSLRKLQKVPSATYKTPKRKVKLKMKSENSTSDSGIENTYVPEYVLGKPVQVGVSLAHARHMTYSLILNRDTRRKSDKNFHKGYANGIGCQT
uniref:Uncharacterized protein n=1 Tax=Bactrocera latifrons TaxID=174628 RepID=A0A0K8WJL3_BACLA